MYSPAPALLGAWGGAQMTSPRENSGSKGDVILQPVGGGGWRNRMHQQLQAAASEACLPLIQVSSAQYCTINGAFRSKDPGSPISCPRSSRASNSGSGTCCRKGSPRSTSRTAQQVGASVGGLSVRQQ